jgi:hypothetical protein
MKLILEEYDEFNLILESIEDSKKKYANIPEDKFMELISLDPTYDENKDKLGIYGNWILTAYSKNRLSNLGHVTDVLTSFDENKKNLKNKDISSFKTLEDIDNYLNDDNSYNELSKRQQLRQTQKSVRTTDVEKDADKVYEDKYWVVYVPKTYQASCKLGRGTTWCTATTETDRYYKDYTSSGKLYIIINKSNPEEKYQFHFETESFMDKDDEDIDFVQFFAKDLTKNSGLFNYFDENEYSNDLASYFYNVEFVIELSKNNYTVSQSTTRDDDFKMWHYDSIPLIRSIDFDTDDDYIEEKEFEEFIGLEEINIPEKITDIGKSAFKDCPFLSNLTLPKTLKIIRAYAFENCDKLSNINFNDGTPIIMHDAFRRCSNLSHIELAERDATQRIDAFAFFECPKLKTVNYNGTVESFNNIYCYNYDNGDMKLMSNMINKVFDNGCTIICKDGKINVGATESYKYNNKLILEGFWDGVKGASGAIKNAIKDTVTKKKARQERKTREEGPVDSSTMLQYIKEKFPKIYERNPELISDILANLVAQNLGNNESRNGAINLLIGCLNDWRLSIDLGRVQKIMNLYYKYRDFRDFVLADEGNAFIKALNLSNFDTQFNAIEKIVSKKVSPEVLLDDSGKFYTDEQTLSDIIEKYKNGNKFTNKLANTIEDKFKEAQNDGGKLQQTLSQEELKYIKNNKKWAMEQLGMDEDSIIMFSSWIK